MTIDAAYVELQTRGRLLAFQAAAQCVELLRRQSSVDVTQFCRVLETHIELAFEEAVLDARVAYESGLQVVAEITFEASMRIAGMKAACEVMGV